MASKKLLENLVALNKAHRSAFVWLSTNATDPNLLAHFVGTDILIKGLSGEQTKALAELDKAIKTLESLKMPTADLKVQKSKLGQANMSLALKAVDDKRKSAGKPSDKVLPENCMVGCEFRSAMALYRFCSVNAESWEIWSVDVPTRRGTLVIASVEVAKSLVGKGEDGANIIPTVTSPTHARKICMLCHRGFADNVEPGLASIVAAFKKAEFPNAGGIGTTNSFAYLFGKYAKLFESQAGPWLTHMRKHGVLPASESLKKRAK